MSLFQFTFMMYKTSTVEKYYHNLIILNEVRVEDVNMRVALFVDLISSSIKTVPYPNNGDEVKMRVILIFISL